MSSDLYLIGCGPQDALAAQRATASAQTMGFKAWNLLRMADIGLTVPPAFVLGTAFCTDADSRCQAGRPATWADGLRALEARCGLGLGDRRRPLLLSVRSGAPVSMPGMMETLLNIGLCDATLPGLIRQGGNPRLAWDAYRRLVASFGEVVAGIPGERFEAQVTALTAGRDERTLDFAELRTLTQQHLDAYVREAGRPFPQDPVAQLSQAISAVLASWQSPKAIEYRRVNQLPDTLGTAVTVQTMVFGNAGGHSGAGVGFTRDPATGEPHLWVDFLFNAQGEDVVSGRRSAHGHDALAQVLPAAWTALQEAAHQLELHLGDMQDFEFTVQDGRLYMLQTRNGKRTPQAAARIALDLFDEGLITAEVARQRTAGLTREMLSRTRVVADGPQDASASAPEGGTLAPQALQPLASAATACSGVACGEIAFDEARARARHAAGAQVILLRRDAETSDIAALEAAQGLLTARGARTSHAAVVARQMGKVCLVGCAALHLDEAARTATFDTREGEVVLREGEVLTLDGNEGRIYPGAVRTEVEEPVELLARLDRLATA
ncbi:MAG: pyruvate, phosphate dikinase [Proteobacteria bacterium]|uniref:PEP/pyruvate-binding domain-containing protein n=1 Tax=Aquabacterium sp. TaxID=1872578 RepID=UPI0035C66767|nr:pyruvate, phosphate dikinase [Pseudomonadota bacterium]